MLYTSLSVGEYDQLIAHVQYMTADRQSGWLIVLTVVTWQPEEA